MKRVALSATLVLACVFAGIAQAAPTRSEFIRNGDALCAQAKRELAPIAARLQRLSLPPQMGQFTGAQWAAAATLWADRNRVLKRFSGRFKAFGTPAGDTVAQKILAGVASGVTLATRVQRGLAERNEALVKTALPAYFRVTLATNTRVVAYGFRTCGR